MRFSWLLVLWAVLFATPASAEWHEASSDHFVVYSDQNPKEIRIFSERLERFHAALQSTFKRNNAPPSPSNRVTVYVVRNQNEVRELFGENASRYIGGFYVPRAGGSFAIVPRVSNSGLDVSGSERVLYHEYAHHFLFGSTAHALPLWVTEGFAEFYSTVRFEKDGSVGLGLPAIHRAPELFHSKNVPIERLFDTKAYLASRSDSYDEFYGKSWLLFHYLQFSAERKPQWTAYLTAIASGKSEMEAATTSFGDLKALAREIDRYLLRKRLPYVPVPAAKLTLGAINVRALDPGEAAAMPIVIRSRRGVNAEQAAALLPKAQAVAQQYPKSAAVLAALAEAEVDAGNSAAAIAAADAAIAIDAKQINAQLQKGYALANLASSGSDDQLKAWNAVRAQFLKVNAIENDHPIPLVRYYLTYRQQGNEPTKNAVEGLEWALQLAPFDMGLRMTVATQQMSDKRFDAAIATLGPAAANPHNAQLRDVASRLIAVAKEKGSIDKTTAGEAAAATN